MARPIKNSCDYFPHDSGMRNHPKVKALRHKFQNGYSIWVMLLEYLTGTDGNVFEYSDLQFELIGGDFGVSVTEIREVVDYCIRLEMLFMVDGFVHSESLDERLAPVYTKRGHAKEFSSKQKRLNGRFCNSNSVTTAVSAVEKPQIKLKENRVDKTTFTKSDEYYPFDQFWIEYEKKVGPIVRLRKIWNSISVADRKLIKDYIPFYKLNNPDKKYRKNPLTFLNNRSWFDEIIQIENKELPQKNDNKYKISMLAAQARN